MRVKITEFHPEDAYYATTDGDEIMKEVIIVHNQAPAFTRESDWIYIHGVVESTGDTTCFYACKYEVLGDK